MASAYFSGGDGIFLDWSEGHTPFAPSGDPLRLEEVPASPAVRLVPGPPGTLLAGFGDGTVGVWSLQDGRSLYRAKLHGAAIHLVASDRLVFAASELGDSLTLSLDAFGRDYCDLLREVWGDVDVVWRDGRPAVAPIPQDHACRAAPPLSEAAAP